MNNNIKFSLVIPVYKNRESLPLLLDAVRALQQQHRQMETIFVVDGCPQDCYGWLAQHLPDANLRAQLLLHSRNFGSFAAIRTGMTTARGSYCAVMAADLQEPPELVAEFFHALENDGVDVVLGTRDSREDPFFSKLASQIFWGIYRRYVQPDMPAGGIDMFGCNQLFREKLLALPEQNSSLVGLILWLGFKRKCIGYHRRARAHGASAWTLRRKLNYLLDSVFAFSDLPLKLLMSVGGLAMLIAFIVGVAALIAKLSGQIAVPGYTMLIIAISFFGALNMFALGVVGSYVWRAFENTKARPIAVLAKQHIFDHDGKDNGND